MRTTFCLSIRFELLHEIFVKMKLHLTVVLANLKIFLWCLFSLFFIKNDKGIVFGALRKHNMRRMLLYEKSPNKAFALVVISGTIAKNDRQ